MGRRGGEADRRSDRCLHRAGSSLRSRADVAAQPDQGLGGGARPAGLPAGKIDRFRPRATEGKCNRCLPRPGLRADLARAFHRRIPACHPQPPLLPLAQIPGSFADPERDRLGRANDRGFADENCPATGRRPGGGSGAVSDRAARHRGRNRGRIGRGVQDGAGARRCPGSRAANSASPSRTMPGPTTAVAW